ncbi:hypothetical protein FACS1894199_04360 [Bacteroidia bacterium]|nr:hypothetical protein FACS1894199_04360 [Bacteroidia bacterium]
MYVYILSVLGNEMVDILKVYVFIKYIFTLMKVVRILRGTAIELVLMVLIALVAVVISSCDEDETKPQTGDPIETGTYLGRLTVEQNGNTSYEQDSVSLKVSDLGGIGVCLVDITMYGVKFSPKMPVTLDMNISPILAEQDSVTLGWYLTGDSIVPTAGPSMTEHPEYIITNLQGTMVKDSLTILMSCSALPISFKGKLKDE